MLYAIPMTKKTKKQKSKKTSNNRTESGSLSVLTPKYGRSRSFSDSSLAYDYLVELYDAGIEFLSQKFGKGSSAYRYRSFYPEVSLRTTSHTRVDSRLSYGYVGGPGDYSTTITHPRLFESYLKEQLSLLMENHGVSVTVGISDTPIPLHFALSDDSSLTGDGIPDDSVHSLRDIFDVPDLTSIDDRIVNSRDYFEDDLVRPLAPFTAPRIDFSLRRLPHYTSTSAEHFQQFVLFTNYQFYVDAFLEFCSSALKSDTGYTSLVCPGDREIFAGDDFPALPDRLPQMPAWHLKRADGRGVTLVNIGVGPSNAKTITDHIAVLRPHTWLMLGHCAGLRNNQQLGDYVLAHAYVREDHVLDEDLPAWVPIPPLAEVQVAIERAVADVTGYSGYDLKRLMRTGTVATVDNRNWELRTRRGPIEHLSQSRAIAMDMESATIAANGFRFRVPYGTLLCVSDKPLHGELKLPGMASDFYHRQVRSHLEIGVRAMESLREMPLESLHSRKLRSFWETAFR